MKRAIGTAITCILFMGPTHADDLIPSWVTKEKLAGLKTIGIDPESDLQCVKSRHFNWRAQHVLTL